MAGFSKNQGSGAGLSGLPDIRYTPISQSLCGFFHRFTMLKTILDGATEVKDQRIASVGSFHYYLSRKFFVDYQVLNSDCSAAAESVIFVSG